MAEIKRTVYRIRNSSGQYSKGGIHPKFVPPEKLGLDGAWTSMAEIRSQVSWYMKGQEASGGIVSVPTDWEAVEYEVTEIEKKVMPIAKPKPGIEGSGEGFAGPIPMSPMR